MRPKLMRKSRPVHVAAGALLVATPAGAAVLGAREAQAQPQLQINLNHHQLDYGQRLDVRGNAPAADAGQQVVLELTARAGATWRAIGRGRIRRDGRFDVRAPVGHSGLIRVVGTSSVAARSGSSGGSAPAPVGSSSSQSVAVRAQFDIAPRAIAARGSQSVHLHGELLPGVGGRSIHLEARSGGGWRTLKSTRTGPHGGFDLRFTASSAGKERLRVRFDGDRLNLRAHADAGRVIAYRQSVASWYNDGGSTACGFHAHFGVANKTLPCGTKVSFYYGGRSVDAVVDDRGPFVAGRDWDLNQNTAAALGMGGVATVWSSI